MSPRIKALAEQAGFIMWGNETWNTNGDVVDWCSRYDDALEKFAALIVAECLQQTQTVQNQTVVNAAEYYMAGRVMGMEVAMNQIKQHFGVQD